MHCGVRGRTLASWGSHATRWRRAAPGGSGAAPRRGEADVATRRDLRRRFHEDSRVTFRAALLSRDRKTTTRDSRSRVTFRETFPRVFLFRGLLWELHDAVRFRPLRREQRARQPARPARRALGVSDRPQARGEALARPRSRRGVASRTRVSRVRTDGGAGRKKEQDPHACRGRARMALPNHHRR